MDKNVARSYVSGQTSSIKETSTYYLGSNENLSLTLLSEKLAMLVMLATMCHKCELSYLNLDNIIKYDKKVIVFRLDTLPKNINYQTPVGKANELVTFTVRCFKNNPLLFLWNV